MDCVVLPVGIKMMSKSLFDQRQLHLRLKPQGICLHEAQFLKL